MDFCKKFDKMSTPMFVCSNDWTVKYKNKMCKKIIPLPRVDSKLDSRFVGSEKCEFPSDKKSILFPVFDFGSSYKVSICFNYKGYAVVLFPSLFEHDQLAVAFYELFDEKAVQVFRDVFDCLSSSAINESDKYGKLENARKYIYNIIDDMWVMSFLGTDRNIVCSLTYVYKSLRESVAKVLSKIGHRFSIDYTEVAEYGNNIYIDVIQFLLVFVNIMLFCSSISKNKTCCMKVIEIEGGVRNCFEFLSDSILPCEKDGDFSSSFMKLYPAEYFNLIPFEALCDKLGWNISYCINENDNFNMKINFDVCISDSNIFRSGDEFEIIQSPLEFIENIVKNIFSIL